MVKYSDVVINWLVEAGYTHCFFVPGGNIMHLINSANNCMTCIGFVHEVGATIAAEYFNEVDGQGKAFVLVTAGPGLTNALTGIAGAHLESRELLVVGGQVKTADLSHGSVRQKGLQEVDGVAMAKPVTKVSVQIVEPVDRGTFLAWVKETWSGRPGAVFVEFCLDVQGREVDPAALASGQDALASHTDRTAPSARDLGELQELVAAAVRPVLLLGGGVSRKTVKALLPQLATFGMPIMTTWNGADRIPSDHPMYFGRPNTWGQRSSNVLINQADLLIALGTRLGLQQTGFNWQEFVAGGKIVQVDCDAAELTKGHPKIFKGIAADADAVLASIAAMPPGAWQEWVEFSRSVRGLLPNVEAVNHTGPGFVSPHDLVTRLSGWARPDDVIIPCSSGGAFTVMMHVFSQRADQRIVTNKSLASMGYGLSGAIGAALAFPLRRTILTEGDGGFSQNIQELGTVAVNNLNLKIFIFDDSGYASIRTTQRNYFNGKYFGCDKSTGLGLPDWEKLFPVYGIPVIRLRADNVGSDAFFELFDSKSPAAFVVSVDPEQTYWPKIQSRIVANGALESAPLHLISPDLPANIAGQVFKYLT